MVLNTTVWIDIVTSHPTTGSATDADAPPVVDVFENDNDTPILTVSAVKRTGQDGNYRAKIPVTQTNGFEINKSYAAIASASLGGVDGKAVVMNFYIYPLY